MNVDDHMMCPEVQMMYGILLEGDVSNDVNYDLRMTGLNFALIDYNLALSPRF